MNITSNLKEISQCQKLLEIEVPHHRVESKKEKIIKQYINRVKIKGFRPGKAPKDLIERLYKEEIKNDLINELIPEIINEVFKEKKINPLNSPVVKEINYEHGKPLTFSVLFEILPDFDVENYKGIEVEKKKVDVKNKEIDNYLKSLQERFAEFVPSKRKIVEKGDYVIIEIKGKYLNENKELSPEKLTVIAGHSSNEPVLNENLIGMKINEEKSFIINFPNNYNDSKLAGKKVEYHIKVLSIKERKLPEVNDDFAKSVGEYNNLNELKKDIKEKIKEEKERIQREEMVEKILEKISKKTNFEVPKTLVDAQIMAMVRREEFNRLNEDQRKELFAKLKPEAEKRVKHYLILRKIAKKENIEVKEEEIEEEIKKLAEINNVPYSVMKREMEENDRKEDLKNNLLIRKTVDFLLKEAIIKGRVQ
ncbi:trigger factor [SCandidatus Aminicenantes bacterium Aminicenantia_JdfR_composite]|jgi:trigger factor|nr:trigger factor [SCandidatus Aminicenantes bacterium Aminicenantia_JdfR_composite]MCP2597052.1 trigger factor [Candidatus Aminicenantes bacterium AC-335-G13]MCP2598006.1 trigger factor [Candidatus Aminicenantes bacterium AC-335-L06]MCP2605658.1 trigger factor [Candidatus Aminicenantes bacterium AC-335-O07]MCP2606167.1 trigger factor [Candidatus Aminicenantes bacterium AC-708-I09]